MRATLYGLLTLVLCSAASALGDEAPSPSVSALFGNPTFSSPRLSDDGEWIAYVESRGDEQQVVVRPVVGGDAKAILRVRYAETRLSGIDWKGSELLLISGSSRFSRGPAVGRVTRLFSLDRTGGELRWLGRDWGWTQFEDNIISRAPKDPKRMLVALHGGVEWVDARTGARETVQESRRPIGGWYADANGDVRAGVGWENERYKLFARVAPGDPLIEVANYEALEVDGPTFVGFHADPAKLYVLAPHDGRDALFELEIATRKLSAPILAHAEVDIGGVVSEAPSSRRVVAVEYTVDRRALQFFDAAMGREHASLEKALSAEFGAPVQVTYESTDARGVRVVVEAASDQQPPAYYLFDRATKSLNHLFDSRPELDARRLAPMRAISFAARDGHRIPGYLTLPLGSSGKNLPFIVLPHGGPWARDAIEWNPEVQAFASRGFAVLQINFRGSTGYGKAHLEAGFREVGKKIQDDITDGVRWLIAEGTADPDRIGIYGASHGGYASLLGPIAAPELFRAAASYAGVCDQGAHLAYWRRYFSVERASLQRIWGGGALGDTARLRAVSPLRRAAELNVPVLLGHGEDDQIVSVAQSRDMAAALRKAGKSVEYLEFPHEIHGFVLEANRIRWYEALIAFFEKNLAPRAAKPEPSSPAVEESR